MLSIVLTLLRQVGIREKRKLCSPVVMLEHKLSCEGRWTNTIPEHLPLYIEDLLTKPYLTLERLHDIRLIISLEKPDKNYIQQLFDSGVVLQHLSSLLIAESSDDSMRMEIAWIFTNMSSTDSDQNSTLLYNRGVPDSLIVLTKQLATGKNSLL